MLTYEEASILLSYDPDSGFISWRKSPARLSGKTIAGTLDGKGYMQVNVRGRIYRSHRLAWLLHYGSWPKKHIDHINGNGLDNRIANLREASDAENHQNLKMHANNSSGYTGVSWDRVRGMWQAGIKINYKRIGLGKFSSKEEAYAAYCEAKSRLHTFQPTVRQI